MKLQRIICCSLALALAALGLALGGCFTGGINTSDGMVVGVGSHDADAASFSVLVVDETTGDPMPDVRVEGAFYTWTPMWDRVKGGEGPKKIRKQTDAHGMAYFTGIANCGDVSAIVEDAVEGYYSQGEIACRKFACQGKDGSWLPDNLVITIALQRVEHPIPLYARRLNKDAGAIFGEENKLEYDFLLEDWLPPKGTGIVADVVFSRLPTENCRITNSVGRLEDGVRYPMGVDFPGDGNGIQEIHSAETSGIRIRRAPESGYKPGLVRYEEEIPHGSSKNNFDRDRCFCFRIRTRIDADGKVVGGYYGKIYRDVSFKSGPYGNPPVDSVEMEYYLNPTAHDRNLEFNKKSLSRCPNNRWWEWH